MALGEQKQILCNQEENEHDGISSIEKCKKDHQDYQQNHWSQYLKCKLLASKERVYVSCPHYQTNSKCIDFGQKTHYQLLEPCHNEVGQIAGLQAANKLKTYSISCKIMNGQSKKIDNEMYLLTRSKHQISHDSVDKQRQVW